MDDAEGGKPAGQRPGQYSGPQYKYMDMLQKVADRKLSEVTIEMDDLENVGDKRNNRFEVTSVELISKP